MTFAQLIGMFFVAIGAGIVLWALWNLVQAIGSRNWKTTEGIVLVSELQRSRDPDGGLMYRPEISYQYTADGHEFVASRTRFGQRLALSWSGPAIRAVRRYPAGKTVLVYFDPQDPAEAVLEPGISAYVFAGLLLGALFLFFGIAAIVAA